VRTQTAKRTLWLGMSVALITAVVATGAFGVSGSDKITTIAGNGKRGFSGDGGPATSAQLNQPHGVAVDGQGNVYISDAGNYRVRKVRPGGTITTFAGDGTPGILGDGGPATAARLSHVNSVAVDRQGNVYISDHGSGRVRKVSLDGTITTIAGGGSPRGDGGPATLARLYAPLQVAVDGPGNVYIADYADQRVRKVSPGGTITTFAGTGKGGFSGDGGPATSAQLDEPYGVAVDGPGNVYIAEFANHRVRKVSPGGTITTFAGTGKAGFSGDGGPATSAQLNEPVGVAVDGRGNVYIADFRDHRVRRVSGGTITTLAGTGAGSGDGGFSGDGGPASSAQLSYPFGVAVDGQGNVYITDRNNGRVRKVGGSASAAAALKLTLGGASPQPLLDQKAITVTARCSRPCSLAATGTVTIVGTRNVFGLTRATAKLAAGKRTLTLRFPAAEQQRFRRLLKAGQQARAVITVRAKDTAGNMSTSKRTVAVQR
jgi:hypothetical protein